MRHGKAEDTRQGFNDTDRRLTKKGREEILAAGHWMAEQGLRFDLIAASPLVRAQETAGIIAGCLGKKDRPATWKELVPGGNPDTVYRLLANHAGLHAVLLVGHEPLLSALISRIIAGTGFAAIAMPKGALAKIRKFSPATRPSGELHWLVTASLMAGTK